MANSTGAFGLRPVRHRSGGAYTGGVNTYQILVGDGTQLCIGDLVKIDSNGADATGKYPAVVRAATGDIIAGVIVGFEPNPDNLSLLYRPALTARKCYVCDDPDVLFEVMEVNSGTPLAAADVGLNINFVVAAGSTTTGLSGTTINNATEATTDTLDLKLHALVNREDNDLGAAAKWLVSINRHRLGNQVAGY